MLCPTITEVSYRQWTRISPPLLLVHGIDPFLSLDPSPSRPVRTWEEKRRFSRHNNNNNNNKIFLKIRNISNYISFPPQLAYKLIEAGRSKDILQIQTHEFNWLGLWAKIFTSDPENDFRTLAAYKACAENYSFYQSFLKLKTCNY